MADCIDKKFESMLHAYELGMLSDADREQFEMHLLECEHCYDIVRENEPMADLLKFDNDVRGTIEEVVRELPPARAGRPDEKPARRSNVIRTLVPTLAAAAVLLLLILRPWQISIVTHDPATAVENRLAVMYFENLVEPEDSLRLGEIITNLLVTDLSESRYVRTVSSQRIYDILKLMGLEGTRKIDRDVATQVAQKAEARWMLLGAIVQTEPRLTLTSQLVEVSTGNAIASQRLTASEDEDVFALVDRLTVTIKTDLVLPAEALTEVDRHIADVTTHSTEAFRHYVEGVDFYNKYYFDDAEDSFEKVVELDSTFAMAYYYLTRLRSDSLARERAVRHAENACEKDQYFIRSNEALLNGNLSEAANIMEEMLERYGDEKEALFMLGLYHYRQSRFADAIDVYTRALSIDPLYGTVYNMLAYSYDRTGDWENAIWAINKYISLAPNDANPYDSRGDIYRNNKQYDLAIDSYRKALEKKPNFINSWWKLAATLLRTGQVDEASRHYDSLRQSNRPAIAFVTGFYQSIVEIWRGHLTGAMEMMDRHNEWTRKERPQGEFPSNHTIKAFIQRELGDLENALASIREARRLQSVVRPADSGYSRRFEIQMLAELGRFDEARTETEKYKQYLERREIAMSTYHYILGVIALEQGSLDDAEREFLRAAEDTVSRYPESRFMLGRTYLKAERYREAAEIIADISADHVLWPETMDLWLITSHYYLGLAYEGMGDTDRAAEQYAWLVETWKDADVEIPILTDAIERLARLKS